MAFVDSTQLEIQQGRHSMPKIPHSILDELLACNAITYDQCEAARTRLAQHEGGCEPFHTLGEGLVWLSQAGLFTTADLEALKRTSTEELALSTRATRKQALEEFYALVQQVADEQYREFNRQFWARLLPGPRWVWMIAAPCVLLAGAWYIFAPEVPPACDDSAVKRTVAIAMFEAQMKQLPFTLPSAERPNLLGATLKDVSEVGYIKSENSRGCTATLKVDGSESPLGYTVGPDPDSNEFRVAGGNPRIIRAKYGLAKDGKLPEGGQPVGELALRTSFTQAVVALESRPAQASAFAAARRARLKMQGRESEADKPTVRSVIPLSPCTPTEAGRYSCRLQVQYIDELMSTVGSGELQVFDGDFEFEQHAGKWQVASGFDKKFLEAQARARLADLKGEDAARALEEIQRKRTSAPAPAHGIAN